MTPRLISIASIVLISAALVGSVGCGPSAVQQPAPAGTPEQPAAGPTASPKLEPIHEPGSFAENPIVYFAITDRFFNGNQGNDHSYGRQPDGNGEIGTFHGGDLAGLTRKLEDGYFRDLGVNALWITAPYQQMLGWVVGGNKEFKHYAYHGYYALDFTVLDRNMGTEDELRKFVDTAHSQGIRVIFDVVMNHPGYADLTTLKEYGIEVVWDGWQQANVVDYHSFIDYNDFDFKNWWGPDWVRSDLPGYEPGHSYDERTKQLSYLPDFKTESKKPVSLPPFLAKKPDTRARAMEGYTVRMYLVDWLTHWVREYGVDGFRCDTAKHVDLESWAELKKAGVKALEQWKQANPGKKIDDAPFWMTGEVFPHGVVRSEYFDHGFDSLINFDFQTTAMAIQPDDWKAVDELYADYASAMNATKQPFDVLSYLSSHDTQLFPRSRLIQGGTLLLLAPGGVQIFYGDETARPIGMVPASDPQQGTRSSMNWSLINREVLAHWQALARFRQRHVALARGMHKKLGDQPYTFARVHPRDRVVVALGATGNARVPVSTVFADGDFVRNAYTGETAQVKDGAVVFQAGKYGVILLEKMQLKK